MLLLSLYELICFNFIGVQDKIGFLYGGPKYYWLSIGTWVKLLLHIDRLFWGLTWVLTKARTVNRGVKYYLTGAIKTLFSLINMGFNWLVEHIMLLLWFLPPHQPLAYTVSAALHFVSQLYLQHNAIAICTTNVSTPGPVHPFPQCIRIFPSCNVSVAGGSYYVVSFWIMSWLLIVCVCVKLQNPRPMIWMAVRVCLLTREPTKFQT